MHIFEEIKENWKLVLFYLIATGCLVAYTIDSGRFLVLGMWLTWPVARFIYRKYIKRGH